MNQNRTDRQRAWFHALDHARLVGVKPMYIMAGDYYRVTSPRTGIRYTIRRHDAAGVIVYSCSCPACRAGNVCWHRALVMALPYEQRLRREHGHS